MKILAHSHTHLCQSLRTAQSQPCTQIPPGYTVLGAKVYKVREPKRWGLVPTRDGEI